tara:strand:- start:346 stop:744 length:399 start_codon:yes stop_codon:yes gene_type:complete
MSNNGAASLPNPQDAYNQLYSDVHTEVFLGKLASYGIQPTTEKEAADLFAIAGQLRHVDGPEKQAADQSRFGGASNALGTIMNQTPAGQQQAAASHQHAIKSAAAQLSQDPSVYNAVLSLKLADAATLAGDQ